jgi:carboxyl-terminal processing protease
MRLIATILMAASAALLLAGASNGPDYAAAAAALDAAIDRQYAYPEKLPGGELPRSRELDAERAAVSDSQTLLRYAEDRMMSLADHHAITGSSFTDSWAVVPTFSDVWVVVDRGRYLVDAVRDGSPAARAGVKRGDLLTSVDGVDTAAAVAAFWSRIGLSVTPARAAYAARVLAAGRRDRDRHLAFTDARGQTRELALESLYRIDPPTTPLTVTTAGARTVIRFNNSLGDDRTVAAFDAAMMAIPSERALVLDLRETPSGGNTTIARAIMGWFVTGPHGYQVHSLPSEERETGIARQWIEQVLPRKGKFRRRQPTIWVGRWTGSMGEGLAIGFASMGAEVDGTRMAGLNGSVEDIRLGDTDLTVKLPTERLMTTGYQPREDFTPMPRAN